MGGLWSVPLTSTQKETHKVLLGLTWLDLCRALLELNLNDFPPFVRKGRDSESSINGWGANSTDFKIWLHSTKTPEKDFIHLCKEVVKSSQWAPDATGRHIRALHRMVMCAKLWNTTLLFDSRCAIQCLGTEDGDYDSPQEATTAFASLLVKYLPTFEEGSVFRNLYEDLIKKAAETAAEATLAAAATPAAPCGPSCDFRLCRGCRIGYISTVAVADVTPAAAVTPAAVAAAAAAAEALRAATAAAKAAAAAAAATRAAAAAAAATRHDDAARAVSVSVAAAAANAAADAAAAEK